MDRNEIDKVYGKTLVISLALPVGVVMFGVVGYVIVSSGSIESLGPPFGTALLTAAAAVGLLVIFLVGRAVNAAQARGPLRSSADAIRWFSMTTLVPLAVREGVGLFGIVLGILAGSTSWIVVFTVGAVTSMFMAMPRQEGLEVLARRLNGDAE